MIRFMLNLLDPFLHMSNSRVEPSLENIIFQIDDFLSSGDSSYKTGTIDETTDLTQHYLDSFSFVALIGKLEAIFEFKFDLDLLELNNYSLTPLIVLRNIESQS